MAFKLRAKGAMNVQVHILIPEANTPLTIEYYDDLIIIDKQKLNEGVLVSPNDDYKLIKENKKIYTSFYRFPVYKYDYDILCKVHDIAVQCTYVYPKSIFMLSKVYGIGILDILECIMIKINNFKDIDNIVTAILNYINNIINSKSIKCLALEHILYYESYLAQIKMPKKDENPSFSPLFLYNVYLKKFNFDVKNLIKTIESEKEYIPINNNTYVLIVTASLGQSIKIYFGISIFKANIIKLAMQGMDLQQIYDALLKKYNLTDKKLKDIYNDALISLCKMMVLREDAVNEYINGK